MRRTSSLLAALILCVSGTASAQTVALELTSPLSQVPSCPGTPVELTIHLSNPGGLAVGGYQVFVSYPADLFEAVRYEPIAMNGDYNANGRAPLGAGFGACSFAVTDPWSDGAGRDVVAVIASVYGAGSGEPLDAASADLGRLVFLPRGVPTGEGGAVFRVAQEACSVFADQSTRVFGADGAALTTTPPADLPLTVTDGGLYLPSFVCVNEGSSVLLSWGQAVGGNARGYKIYRNGTLFQDLAIPGIFQLRDSSPPAGSVRYEIAVKRQDLTEGCRSSCTVERLGVFVRGDVDRNGAISITDAVRLLGRLFQGQGALACDDAADADDTGELNLTDAVTILNHLFGGRTSLPPPFPGAGSDPTSDVLTCDR